MWNWEKNVQQSSEIVFITSVCDCLKLYCIAICYIFLKQSGDKNGRWLPERLWSLCRDIQIQSRAHCFSWPCLSRVLSRWSLPACPVQLLWFYNTLLVTNKYDPFLQENEGQIKKINKKTYKMAKLLTSFANQTFILVHVDFKNLNLNMTSVIRPHFQSLLHCYFKNTDISGIPQGHTI